MSLIALLVALICLIGGLGFLAREVATFSFSWIGLLLHLINASLIYGIIHGIGRAVDRTFSQAVHDLLTGGTTEKVWDKEVARVFNLLLIVLLPFLVYVLALALYVTIAVGTTVYSFLMEQDRVPLFLPLGLLIIMGGATLAILVSLYRLLDPLRPSSDGRALLRDHHARLWRISEDIAQSLGTRPVDRIIVTAEPGIAVYEDGGLLRSLLGRSRRVLEIGLPSLHDLTVAEFSAILVHEYGHFSHRDTQWGLFNAYVGNALVAALRSMPGVSEGEHGPDDLTDMLMWLNPGQWIVRLYGSLYWSITGSFSRLGEVMADLKAAQFYGGPTVHAALLKVAMNDLAFDEAIRRRYARSVLKGGALATDCLQLIQDFYATAEPAELRRLQRAILHQEQPDPHDTHPPIQMRLDYADRFPSRGDGSTEPVADLFDEWETITAAMTERFNQSLLVLAEA